MIIKFNVEYESLHSIRPSNLDGILTHEKSVKWTKTTNDHIPMRFTKWFTVFNFLKRETLLYFRQALRWIITVCALFYYPNNNLHHWSPIFICQKKNGKRWNNRIL